MCASADEFDVMQGRAETAEAQVEDLKVQLDDAFGAEDVLDQLTERNLTLSEVRSVPCSERVFVDEWSAASNWKKRGRPWKTSRRSKSSTMSSKRTMSKPRHSC